MTVCCLPVVHDYGVVELHVFNDSENQSQYITNVNNTAGTLALPTVELCVNNEHEFNLKSIEIILGRFCYYSNGYAGYFDKDYEYVIVNCEQEPSDVNGFHMDGLSNEDIHSIFSKMTSGDDISRLLRLITYIHSDFYGILPKGVDFSDNKSAKFNYLLRYSEKKKLYRLDRIFADEDNYIWYLCDYKPSSHVYKCWEREIKSGEILRLYNFVGCNIEDLVIPVNKWIFLNTRTDLIYRFEEDGCLHHYRYKNMRIDDDTMEYIKVFRQQLPSGVATPFNRYIQRCDRGTTIQEFLEGFCEYYAWEMSLQKNQKPRDTKLTKNIVVKSFSSTKCFEEDGSYKIYTLKGNCSHGYVPQVEKNTDMLYTVVKGWLMSHASVTEDPKDIYDAEVLSTELASGHWIVTLKVKERSTE